MPIYWAWLFIFHHIISINFGKLFLIFHTFSFLSVLSFSGTLILLDKAPYVALRFGWGFSADILDRNYHQCFEYIRCIIACNINPFIPHANITFPNEAEHSPSVIRWDPIPTSSRQDCYVIVPIQFKNTIITFGSYPKGLQLLNLCLCQQIELLAFLNHFVNTMITP